MRPMWKGAITFGLVSVPVTLFKATEEHVGPSMHMVHAKDGGRIKLRRFCEFEDIEVPYAEIAKGYSAEDGREVTITGDDLAELPLPSKKIIDVLAFVDADEIDPLRLTSPYYVSVAGKAPAKPYVLLRDTLVMSGKVAVTRVTLQTRESLAVLRVYGELIVLQTLLWPDEIRSAEGLAPQEESPVRPQELKMARSLMDTLSEGFDLDSLHDEYSQALQRVIEAKLEGAEMPQSEPAAARGGHAIDLMEALRSSVEAAKSSHPKTPAKKPTARKSTASKATSSKASASKASTAKDTGETSAAAKKTARPRRAS